MKPHRDPLLAVGARATFEAVGRHLAHRGWRLRGVRTEAHAVAALAGEPIAATLVAHPVAPSVLSSLLAAAARRHPEVPVIVLGSTASVDEAVDAMRLGAADFVPAPVDPELLLLRLERVLASRRRASPDGAAKPRATAGAPGIPGLVGSSTAMQRLYETVDKVTRYKTNVLLLGESGSGKELVARALHARGPRRQKLFVPVNCATLGRELLENELFGHERGAFTGANERKQGLFELADGGTLFLDEIAEMDLSTQAKLLRVLERNEFRRVGGTEKVRVDLSVIAATHRNLGDSIAAGKFREDLYYRLKVVAIVIPPLREHREDIPTLIEHFIADFNGRNSQQIRGISPALLKRFMQYDWPGNVRELKNAVESAAILASDATLEIDPLDTAARPARAGDTSIPLTATLAQAERQLIAAHVARAKTKGEAARSLGIGLRTLYTKLRAYASK